MAIIHDVTQSTRTIEEQPSKSPNIKAMDEERSAIHRARQRVSTRIRALESYIDEVNTKYTSVEQLGAILSMYESETAKLQDHDVELVKTSQALDIRYKEELKQYPRINAKVVQTASIGLFAPESATLQLSLIYGKSCVILVKFLASFLLSQSWRMHPGPHCMTSASPSMAEMNQSRLYTKLLFDNGRRRHGKMCLLRWKRRR